MASERRQTETDPLLFCSKSLPESLLLGTWSGPGWVAGHSTLLQLLISSGTHQRLILQYIGEIQAGQIRVEYVHHRGHRARIEADFDILAVPPVEGQ